MSRIGKQLIEIPENVKVSFVDGYLSVEGKNGSLKRKIRDEVDAKIEDNKLKFSTTKDTRLAKALWGTYASHAQNMIKGVTDGHQVVLVVEGVGYRPEMKGEDLVLLVGYSNPVVMKIDKGMSVKVEKNKITIQGYDLEQVTAFAANIRKVRKPEPYKGKGIRYEDEVVLRKQGKKAK